MDPRTPDGERRRGPMARALELAADIVASDGYANTSSHISERDAGALRVKQWDKFARKHGLSYRREPSPDEIAADPRLVAMFEDLRGFGYPLNAVAGLLEGTWHGCRLIGFHTFDARPDGKLSPYRFVCAPLGARYPDLVHDERLQYTTDGSITWYPLLDRYEEVIAPKPPTGKPPGLLARTPVGRAVSEKLEGIIGPTRPKLRTSSPEFAERFIAAAYRRFDPAVFDYIWAVRGPWLVAAHFDGSGGLIDNGKRARFLDALSQVKRLIE